MLDAFHHLQLCYFHFVQSMMSYFKDYEQTNFVNCITILMESNFFFLRREYLAYFNYTINIIENNIIEDGEMHPRPAGDIHAMQEECFPVRSSGI